MFTYNHYLLLDYFSQFEYLQDMNCSPLDFSLALSF